MKLLTLNVWGGILFEPLIDFIKKQSADIDIFCFQEMVFGDTPGFTTEKKARTNLNSEICSILPNFTQYSYLAKEGSNFGGEHIPLPNQSKMGQAIFVRDTYKVITNGGFRTYKEDSYHANDPVITVTGNFQYLETKLNNMLVTIGNLHGMWQKDTNKLDTPERMEQSKKIIDFLNQADGAKILVGDFNAMPENQSMKNIEKVMISLIRKYNIKSTRSSIYNKNVKYSDYIFVSPNVEVINFKVLNDEVSDHLPLMLEFK